jgi:hypothetical protein
MRAPASSRPLVPHVSFVYWTDFVAGRVLRVAKP